MSAVHENTTVEQKHPHHDSSVNSGDLPPPRKSKPLKPVSPPLSKTPLNKFIYTLIFILLLVGVFYTYRTVQYKKQVGGWWSLLMGRGPIPTVAVHNQGHGPAVGGEWAGRHGGYHKSCNAPDTTVEHRIDALAQALGMPSYDLARAIAGAVRHHVPPASLSSIAAKETGEVVRILTNDDDSVDGRGQSTGETSSEEKEGDHIFEGVVEGLEKLVGMDEP